MNQNSAPMDEHTRRRSEQVRRVVSWLGLGLGAFVVVAMARRAGVERIAQVCAQAGGGVAWVMLVPVVSSVLHVAGWRALTPSERRLPWLADLARYEAAQAWNELGFSVLGEPLKVWGSPPERREEAMGSLLLDNVAQLLTTVTFLLGGTAYLASRLGHTVGAVPSARVAAVGLVALAAAGALGAAGARQLGVRLPVALQSTATAALSHARQAPGEVAASYLLHLAGKGWMVVEIAVALAVVGSPRLDAAAALTFASVIGSLVGAAVPGQVGAVEAAVGGVGELLAVPLPVCVAVLLLRRARTLLRIAVGLGLARWLVSRDPGWLRGAPARGGGASRA